MRVNISRKDEVVAESHFNLFNINHQLLRIVKGTGRVQVLYLEIHNPIHVSRSQYTAMVDPFKLWVITVIHKKLYSLSHEKRCD